MLVYLPTFCDTWRTCNQLAIFISHLHSICSVYTYDDEIPNNNKKKPTTDYRYYARNVLSINEESQNNNKKNYNQGTYSILQHISLMSHNSPHITEMKTDNNFFKM